MSLTKEVPNIPPKIYTKYMLYRSIKSPLEYDIYICFFYDLDDLDNFQTGFSEPLRTKLTGWMTGHGGKPLVFKLISCLTFNEASNMLYFICSR